MLRSQQLVVVFISAAIVGCASAQLKRYDPEGSSKIDAVRVIVELPTPADIDHSRYAASSEILTPAGGPVAGLTMQQSNTGSAIVGGVIATTLIDLLVLGDIEKVNQERRALYETHGAIFSSGYFGSEVQAKIEALRHTDTRIRILETTYKSHIQPATSTPARESKTATLTLTFEQTLSSDLARLRLRMLATATDGNGREVFRSLAMFLPTSIPGGTSENTMKHWASNGGEVYKELVSLGVSSLIDAIDLTFTSHDVMPEDDTRHDGRNLLSHKNCFGGDYDAGLPLEAYNEGTTLAVRKDYYVVRLANEAILTFPRCIFIESE